MYGMDARTMGMALALTVGIFFSQATLYAAGVRTQNFIVQAGSPQLAQEVATAAEAFRRDLAIEWLGHELPPWHDVCPITVQAAPNLGAGGATSFSFMNGQPGRWTMTIQGSRERVLDSVLPHEITHTIFATHFGRPLPRWADEGACTVVEHVSERSKQEKMLYEFLTTNRGIPFNKMFVMKDYPQDVLPLYSQGYSLSRFFIALGGKQKFVAYVGEGMHTNQWTATTQKFYGFENLSDLQLSWLEWVRQGTPKLNDAHDIVYHSTDPAKHGRTLGEVHGVARTGSNPAGNVQLASATLSASTLPVTAASKTTPRSNSLPLEPVMQNNAAPQEVIPVEQLASSALASNATPLDHAWFARHAEARRGNEPVAANEPISANEVERNSFNSLSRPLPPEGVRQAPLQWSRQDNAYTPSGTKWR
jgi:hypothetical protein